MPKVIWSVLQALTISLFVLGSAALSVSFMVVTFAGHWWPIVAGFVALAVAIEVMKPVLVRGAFGGFGWQFVPVGLAGAAICVAASAYWELQVVSRAREAYAVRVSGHDEKAARLDARRREIADRLREIGKARPVGELAPLIEAAQRVNSKSLPQLKAEAARATEADRLRSELARMDERIDDVAVDPTAEARSVSAVLARFGIEMSPARVDGLLGPAMVVLLQLGAVAAAALRIPSRTATRTPAQSVRRYPQHEAVQQAETPENTGRTLPEMPAAATVRLNDVSVYDPHSNPHSLAQLPAQSIDQTPQEADEEAKARVMAVLTITGPVEAGLRVLADRFGFSNTHAVRRVLNQLVSEGKVRVEVSPRGTKVERI